MRPHRKLLVLIVGLLGVRVKLTVRYRGQPVSLRLSLRGRASAETAARAPPIASAWQHPQWPR